MHPPPQRTIAERRMAAFGLNLIVMAVCFALYELGFFGRVEGPLSPAQIGAALAGWGFTVASFQALLVALTGMLLSWNGVANLAAHLAGRRLTCSEQDPGGGFCGEAVARRRGPGGRGWVFCCPRGHLRGEAHFHPIRKGKLAHSLLLASLAAAVSFALC